MDHNVNCRTQPKMHINPYFIPKPNTTPHFNPNFNCKETRANPVQSQQIHINPRFVQQNQITSNSHCRLKDPVGVFTNPTTLFYNYEQNTSSTRKTTMPALTVCASTSRYKLVNLDYNKPNQMLPQTTEMATNKMHKENHMMHKVTSTAITPTTPLYKTKYCLVRNSKQQNPTKPAPSKQVQGKLVNISRYKSVVLQKILPKKAIALPEKKSNVHSYAKNNLKSVHRKIDRRVRVKQKINTAATNKLNVSLRRHCTNLVTIQGQKFSATSKSLRLIGARSENSKSITGKLSVRVNGRMYVQKSPDLFIRKSAAGALKKNNIPCPSYRKYGRCVRNDRGQCALLHDKKYVVICREFLKGECAKEDCLLSHQVSAEKMPTCSFFLQGCCTRDVCPYQHVKLNDSARVCVDFVKGYCERGHHCPDRHVNMCPSYAERGVCARAKCPYPHNKRNREIKRRVEVKAKTKVEKKEDVKAESLQAETEIKSEATRYYVVDSAENVDGEIHTSRSKLGILPSYIKL